MNFVIFLVDRVQQDLRKGIVKENSNGALNVCPMAFLLHECVFSIKLCQTPKACILIFRVSFHHLGSLTRALSQKPRIYHK